MVGTIGYLGKVQFKLGLKCALLYTLGAAAAGSLLGAILGGAGWLLSSGLAFFGVASIYVLTGLAIFVLFVCVVLEICAPKLWFPQRRQQVPRGHWHYYGPRMASLRWGAVLGIGFWTPIIFPLYFGVVALAISSASPLLGAVVMGVYGGTQGLSLLWIMLRLRWGADHIMDNAQTAEPMRLSHRINAAAALSFGLYLLYHLVMVKHTG
jgi:cytochrome c biogenesis protein CcdA